MTTMNHPLRSQQNRVKRQTMDEVGRARSFNIVAKNPKPARKTPRRMSLDEVRRKKLLARKQ